MLVVSFAAYVGLWEYYDHTRPPVAAPAQGRIHPLNTHGSIVYLTLEESDYLRDLGRLDAIVSSFRGRSWDRPAEPAPLGHPSEVDPHPHSL